MVLDRYVASWKVAESYQSEDALERELVSDLQNLGYTFEPELNSTQKLIANARTYPATAVLRPDFCSGPSGYQCMQVQEWYSLDDVQCLPLRASRFIGD